MYELYNLLYNIVIVWFADVLLPFCGLQVPGSNPVPGILWNSDRDDVTVLNIEKWPAATFSKKITKASAGPWQKAG